jgi:hypothetical protein
MSCFDANVYDRVSRNGLFHVNCMRILFLTKVANRAVPSFAYWILQSNTRSVLVGLLAMAPLEKLLEQRANPSEESHAASNPGTKR